MPDGSSYQDSLVLLAVPLLLSSQRLLPPMGVTSVKQRNSWTTIGLYSSKDSKMFPLGKIGQLNSLQVARMSLLIPH